MKSAQFATTGRPADVLKVQDVPVPEPQAGQVRVRVTACNINPSDVMFIQGMYGIRPKLPATAGFEACGTVDACGEGVELPVGARVIFTAIGVWQEYVVVPADTVLPAPNAMPDTVACQAFVNPYTAFGMLEVAALQPGQWLMVTAGGSAFGQFVIQLCQQRGINVIATVRRPEQVSALKALGATAVINTETEDLVKRTRELTDRKGVHYVFDAVAGKLGGLALECLARGGTLMVFGALSLQPLALNSGTLIFKELSVRSFWLTTWFPALSAADKQRISKEVLGMLSQQQLKTNVEATYPLHEVVKAVAHADSPGRDGKVLLVLD